MKALRYIDNTGVMRVQVVAEDYELTRDEQRRLGNGLWFEGLYEALGAKGEHDKARKGQPAEPWLKEFVTPGDRQVPTNLVFSEVQDPEDFGLSARYPEAVVGPGAPDDREEPNAAPFGVKEVLQALRDPEIAGDEVSLAAASRLEAVCAERDALKDRAFRYDTGGGFIRSMGADFVEAEFVLLLARAEKAEARVAELEPVDRTYRMIVESWAKVAADLADATARAEKAKAEVARLREALKRARPLVEKWCHYQGNTQALFDEYLGPIDAALAPPEPSEAMSERRAITVNTHDTDPCPTYKPKE